MTTGDYVTPEQAAKLMTAHLRDPLTDPQAGDAFLVTTPQGPTPVRVIHRRDPWVWFAGPMIPIRTAMVADFVKTLEMGNADCMSFLTESELWPEPKS